MTGGRVAFVLPAVGEGRPWVREEEKVTEWEGVARREVVVKKKVVVMEVH